jgi:hypothetical protein
MTYKGKKNARLPCHRRINIRAIVNDRPQRTHHSDWVGRLPALAIRFAMHGAR